MKTIEGALKEIWINKLNSIKNKKIISNTNCIKGREVLDILDSNSEFWIEWYKLIKKEIASFYLDLRIIDIKENAQWFEAIFELGYDIILKDSPSVISRVRGEQYFAKLKKQEDNFYIYTLKEILNNKLQDIDRLSLKYIDRIHEKYITLSTKEEKISLKKINNNYKEENAISYAYRFNRFKNKYYPFIVDNNTTNYISQCLYAGGINQRKKIWFCKQKENIASNRLTNFEITASWYDFEELYKYLINKKIGKEENSIKELTLGDIIQSYNSKNEEYQHSMLISKIEKDNVYITSQYKNISYMDYPIYLLFPNKKFDKYRFIAL